MESLAPVFTLVIELRSSLSAGNSLRKALRGYFSKYEGEFSHALSLWFLKIEQGSKAEVPKIFRKSPFRVAVLRILAEGLRGKPIYQELSQIEDEIHQASLEEIEEFLRIQPMKLLLPLLLFQFPAFLLLLFGPLLQQMSSMLAR